MARLATTLLSGMLMGFGIALSGMINPQKVLGFFDILGAWDPTLAFVMGGALMVTGPAFHWARSRNAPLLGGTFALPTRTDLDIRLVLGAGVFGIGWGLSGFCPGPALAALGSGLNQVVLFGLCMIGGMLLFQIVDRKRR